LRPTIMNTKSGAGCGRHATVISIAREQG
jgi:hypothetical protein